MLTAAQLSYSWLEQNTANVAADISAFTTGAYGVKNDASFRLWAAAEMWETTGDAAALADFEQRANALAANDKVNADFDWGNPKNLGVYTYLLSSRSGRSDGVISALRTQLLQRADGFLGTQAASAYGRALSTYYWGVNGAVARSCMLLQVANQLSPKPEYLDCCVAQIAHLFGRNYYGRSFVTGEGKDPPLHPHHRPSASDSIDQPFSRTVSRRRAAVVLVVARHAPGRPSYVEPFGRAASAVPPRATRPPWLRSRHASYATRAEPSRAR